jgi:hypothetical protein
LISAIKEKLKLLQNIRQKIGVFFFKEDGGKTVLNLKRVFLFGGPILFLAIVTTALLSMQEDSSFLGKTDKKILDDGVKSEPQAGGANTYSPAVNKVLGTYKMTGETKKKNQRPRAAIKINFKAAQVISRDNTGDPTRSVPIGTNLIGKTLTAIDTREPNQMIKILLPYGGRSKLGVEIEKGTILFGQVSYSGKGRKVSVTINKGLTPDEREFDIDAQVLDPSNYSVGLVGESNSQSDLRAMSALGLSVAAGAAEIMVERETMNGLGQTAPRPTIGNAALKGLSSSTQEEANRQGEKFKDAEDYITLPAGSDVIVSLTKSYVEK